MIASNSFKFGELIEFVNDELHDLFSCTSTTFDCIAPTIGQVRPFAHTHRRPACLYYRQTAFVTDTHCWRHPLQRKSVDVRET